HISTAVHARCAFCFFVSIFQKRANSTNLSSALTMCRRRFLSIRHRSKKRTPTPRCAFDPLRETCQSARPHAACSGSFRPPVKRVVQQAFELRRRWGYPVCTLSVSRRLALIPLSLHGDSFLRLPA